MKHLDVSEEDLGTVLCRDRTVVNRIINGRQPLKLNEVEPLAEALQVDPLEVLRRAGMWKRRRPPTIRAAAILNQVQAGRFTVMPEQPPSAEETILVDSPRETIFALRVAGDSMDRIAPAGSLVVVDYSQRNLRDGDLGVFRLDDEATFKRLRRSGKDRWLQPESNNPRHGPIFPAPGQTIETIGRLIEIRPEYTGAGGTERPSPRPARARKAPGRKAPAGA